MLQDDDKPILQTDLYKQLENTKLPLSAPGHLSVQSALQPEMYRSTEMQPHPGYQMGSTRLEIKASGKQMLCDFWWPPRSNRTSPSKSHGTSSLYASKILPSAPSTIVSTLEGQRAESILLAAKHAVPGSLAFSDLTLRPLSHPLGKLTIIFELLKE